MDMSIQLFTLLLFGCFFLLLAIGVPFAWTALFLAIVFGFITQGPAIYSFIIYRTWHMMGNFAMIAIPLFVFMAAMLQYSGIADDLFDALYRWMGPLRGGLAITTILVCTVLAAMVGTVGASIAIMGLVALPAMLQRKYNKHLALGSVMAGGGLGIMIPPSLLFIIYGVNAGISIGKLFMGGIGPGLVLAGLYATYIGVRSYLNPAFAPALSKKERTMSLRDRFGLIKTSILPILLILGVLGSIYLGLATPAEAAGIGAAGAILCTAIRRRLTWENLKLACYSTLKTVGIVMWIAFGAFSMIGVFTLVGGAEFISGLLSGLPFGRWGILIFIQLILITLGMFLDPIGIVILCVPIFNPIVVALGFDPLWFGLIFNVNMQIAFLTPPFGFGMFYLKAVTTSDVTMTDLYRSVFPFILLQLVGLTLVMLFPPIATWLPNMMIK